jgi:hypothetical protein
MEEKRLATASDYYAVKLMASFESVGRSLSRSGNVYFRPMHSLTATESNFEFPSAPALGES